MFDDRKRSARLEQRNAELTEELVRMKGELARALARIAALTTRDEETGLEGFEAFGERARIEIARAVRHRRELGLALLAFDGRKSDLRALADLTRANLREYDAAGVTPEREIIIFLPEASLDGARVVAERIRSLIDERSAGGISAGCASWPQHGRTLREVLQRARGELIIARQRRGVEVA